MRTMLVSSAIGILAAFAFACQIGLAGAAEETKKDRTGKPVAISQPGEGIQSTKAKAAESSRMKKGQNCATQGPKIKKVTPDEGKTGEKVTITGERFGQPGCVTMVSFGPGSPAKFTHVDDKTLTAVVPDGKNGLELLTVTAAVGVDSKPFLRK
jgi:IPT/TIG domain-containing protein